MSTAAPAFADLVALLRRRADDPLVGRMLDGAAIERSDYYGYVSLRDRGISVIFQEEPFVLPPEEVADAKAVLLVAFHLHRQDHEGFAQYPGELPHGITFGDGEADVVRKAGQPVATGGGGMSRVLRRPLPRWLRYALAEGARLQLQFDVAGCVEMATLATPTRATV